MVTVEIYTQDRNVLAGSLIGATYALVQFAGETYRYNGAAGYFKIDITDMVRSGLADNCNVTYYDSNGGVVLQETYVFDKKGLLPFEKVLQPLYMDNVLGLKYLPPSYYILAPSLQAEIQTDDMSLDAVWYFNDMGEWREQPLPFGTNILQFCMALGYDDEYIRISPQGATSPAYVMHGEAQKCDREYMLVQWVSRMGNIKRAVWEVENIAEARHDTYNLWDMQNAFDTHAGRLEKCTLVLRNLNAYDYWYYSDIVTSTEVWANRGTFIQDFLQSMKAEVTTKEVTQPAGDIPTTLRVNINYRRYDAL